METRSERAQFAVVSASSLDQLWPHRQQRSAKPASREWFLVGLIAKSGIAYLPLAPEPQRLGDAQDLMFHGFPGKEPGEGHWHDSGHLFASAVMAPSLCGL